MIFRPILGAALTFVLTPVLAADAPDAHTLQLWRFDEGRGASTRDAAHSAVAELVGGYSWSTRREGGAVRFDGRDAMAKVKLTEPMFIGPTQSFTVEAWVRTARQDQTQQVFAATPICEMEVRGENGEVSFNLWADADHVTRCTGTTGVTDGRWHHIAGVRDAKTKEVRLYIDGRLDATVDDATAGKPLPIGDEPIIGGKVNGSEMFEGLIDEVRVSNTARSFESTDNADNAPATTETLENEHTKLVFAHRAGAVWLASLVDKRTGVELVETNLPAHRVKNLWHVTLRGEHQTTALDERDGELTIEKGRDGNSGTLVMRWTDLSVADEAAAADVTLTVRLPDDSPFSRWTFGIDNRSDAGGVWIATAPRLTNLRRFADGHLAIPGGNGGGAGEGQLYREPYDNYHPFVRTYPCYHQSMQFSAYYGKDAGLYLATHDGEMHLKGFLLRPLAGEPSAMSYEVQNYPADAGVTGTGFDARYEHVIGPFTGDWYDAARIYRAWAIKQVWAQAGPLAERDDISPWIRDGAYWFVAPINSQKDQRQHLRKLARTLPPELVQKLVRHIDVESTFDMYRRAYDYFGYPMLLWSNEWFDGGGDTSPPRYIPVNGLTDLMARIDEDLPDAYFSAHIQPKRFSVQVTEYNDEVIASLEKRPDGSLALGPVMPSETYDQHAYPCWATDFWKNHWRDKARDRAALGIDGWHVDELGSATSFDAQCFNRDHDHPVGGGTLYAQTRRDMLVALRDGARQARPMFAAHHEVLCEIYLDIADAAEVCTAPSNSNIPMWEAVYHDYSFVMGRRIMEWTDRNLFPLGKGDGDEHIDEFVSAFAQTYIWGNQPGWTRIDIVDYAPRVASVIKQFMDARYRAMKYLNVGDMMRPLEVTEPLATVDRVWRYCDTPNITLPVVYNSVWKSADGGVAIVLANITDQPQTISYRCDLSECGLDASRYRVTRIDGAEPIDMGETTGPVLERSDTIDGYSVMILEVTP